MEDKKYPIYQFNASWDQEGYNHNSTSYNLMFKEEQTELQLNSELEKFRARLEKKQFDNKQPITNWHTLEYKFLGYEPWMLVWFYHITYNQFESDEQALNSFREFVYEKECENERNGHYSHYYDGHTERNPHSELPYYCFMGADDRWRWEVCHCDDCEKNDWTIIKH